MYRLCQCYPPYHVKRIYSIIPISLFVQLIANGYTQNIKKSHTQVVAIYDIYMPNNLKLENINYIG